jgi:leucyl-tRNA synthetase
MILGLSYKDERGALVPTDQVEQTEAGPVRKGTGEKLVEFPAKMSKSLKNVVNPDDVVREYGADSMRLYEMFMGPLEATKPWSTRGVEGVHRFLKRSWRMLVNTKIGDVQMDKEQLRLLHATIKKVGEDTGKLSFNTAISQMMIFLNEFSKLDVMPREAALAYVKLLSPYAPHLAEEIWEVLGQKSPVSLAPWPEYDEKFLQIDEVDILIQVLGKPKARMMMPASAAPAEMEKLALANPELKAAIEGKSFVKAVCVPKRLVNIVVK